MKHRTFITLIGLLFLTSVLTADDLEDWKKTFLAAEVQYNSRNQSASIPMFQGLVSQILEARKQRRLQLAERGVLVQSLDYLGQTYFNQGDQENARNVFRQIAEIDPNYSLNPDYVSPKIIDFFTKLRDQIAVKVSISSDPDEADIRVDGVEAGKTNLDRFYIAKGEHVIELSKSGYRNQSKTVVIDGAIKSLQFELDPSTAPSLTIRNPAVNKIYEEAMAAYQTSSDKAALAKSLTNIGGELVKLKDYETARHVFQETLTLYQESNDKSGMARSYQELATIFITLGNKDGAQRMLDQAQRLYREQNDQTGLARVSARLGDLRFAEEKLKDALALYGEALPALREAGEKTDVARILFYLGEIDRLLKNSASASAKYREALALYEELGDQNGISRTKSGMDKLMTQTRIEVGTILRDASALMAQNSYGQAEAKFNEAAAMARENGDKKSLVVALINIGFLLNHRSDPGSEKVYQEALQLAKETADKPNMIPALLGIASLQSVRRDYTGAMESYREAVDLAREIGDKKNLAMGLYYMANAVHMLGDEERANRLYNESVTAYRETGQSPRPRPW